ncbi:hypothetical protein BE17_07265 [Sorangium cellulosum]|uniref:Uncharacterized protein n=1 Tax=Sorangium cellulosum TaxID=56 RepID=A0A150S4Z4_SORCE|nr:hypothetical protein BE17_07265 [Sorangium cellulosum]
MSADDVAGEGGKRGRKRATTLRIAAANEPDDRPVIRFVPAELPGAIEQGIAALRADPDLYQRENVLVHVTNAPDAGPSGGDPAGSSPQIHPIALDTLRERLTRRARWLRLDGRTGEWKPTAAPDHVVRGILTRKHWPGIRHLTGILEAPSLRPDGTVIDRPGYDDATGFLYAPNDAYLPIPEQPTLEDAQRALATLEDVFVDFPYASPACRAMAVAAALTLIARPAIRGATPAFIFDANTPASGKSLQADSASLLAFGRVAGRKDFPTDKRGANDEISKALCAYAILGTRLVNFDNLGDDVAFGGPALEMVLTAEHSAEFRILGTNTVTSLPWRTVIFGTGNNIALTRDMLRRCMVSRIESPYERPELRPLSDFKHPERAFTLRTWIRENRIELVTAALTLLRAHACAGRPSPARTWGSFEAWTKVIADAIVWAGGADPLACRPSEEGDDNPEKRALGVVLHHWPRLDSTGQGMTIRSALALLYPLEVLRGDHRPPDGFDDMREAIEQLVPTKPRQQPSADALGKLFRKYKRSNIAGRMLTTAGDDRNKVKRWTVVDATRAALAKPTASDSPAPMAEPSSDVEDLERTAIQDEPQALGPNGCRFADCACRPCINGHCGDPDRPLDGGGCYC